VAMIGFQILATTTQSSICEPDLCCGYRHSWQFMMIKECGTVGFGVLEVDLGCH
jgi:hypothetical protein